MLSKRLKWGLSTLSCPELSFDEASQLAERYGIGALELRALDNQIDLLKHWRENPPDVVTWRKQLQARGQEIVALDTPCLLFGAPSGLDELSEFAEWAERLEVPFLRVFDGGKIGVVPTETDFVHATAFWENWLVMRERHRWRTQLLIETHDAFCNSQIALTWLERQATPPGLVWDVHHTWRHGHEPVEETWKRLKPYVRHIHIKDSIRRGDKIQHGVPGQGDVPFETLFRLIEEEHYHGVVSFEFEKWWRPEIPPLRQCLDACVAMRW